MQKLHSAKSQFSVGGLTSKIKLQTIKPCGTVAGWSTTNSSVHHWIESKLTEQTVGDETK